MSFLTILHDKLTVLLTQWPLGLPVSSYFILDIVITDQFVEKEG